MHPTPPSPHWVVPALLIALAACSNSATLGDDVAIGVGALPGRPGYENVVRGVELAVAELNRVPGVRFRVALPSDSASSAVAVAAAHRADPSVAAVVGHPESGNTQLAIPVYAAVGEAGVNAVAAISPTASSPALSGISPWFFRVAPSDEAGARDVARYAYDSLGFRSAAIVYRNDSYGRDWTTAYAQTWRAMGGRIVVRDPYLADQTDWDLYAMNIAGRNPDVVLFPGDGGDAAIFLRALRTAGARAQFIGGDGTEALAQQPEFAGARYVTFFQADRATSAEAQQFLKAWQGAYRDPPDMFGALSYDAAMAIGAAVRAASPRTREGVRDAIAALAIDGVAGRIAFDPASHDVIGRSVVVSTVRP
jgi:branched-chain amino acid transport system substrate-binding protein